MKLLRPQFSIRTLLVVTTVVGAYFGLLEATKRLGVKDVKNLLAQVTSWVENEDVFAKAPFFVEVGGFVQSGGDNPLDASPNSLTWQRQYYCPCDGSKTLAVRRSL